MTAFAALLCMEGGWLLVLVRALTVAGLLSAFGALVFRAMVLRRVPDAVPQGPAVLTVARVSLAAGLSGLAAWAVVQTFAFLEPDAGVPGMLRALPLVLTGTLFGRVLLGQAAGAAAAVLVLPRRPNLALAMSGAAVLLQVGHGHGWSEDGPGVLAAVGAVHLVAAGTWLGGLVPLLLVAWRSAPRTGAMAARWFSPVGKWCVAGIVGSALVQGWALAGGMAGLTGTPYGWMLLVKMALFVVLFGLAVPNRYRWAPAMRGPRAVPARRALMRAIVAQTAVGLLTVVAAGVLSGLAPPGP